MGLTICKNVVENNNGFIDVYSEGENCGSTFMFGMEMGLPDSKIIYPQTDRVNHDNLDSSCSLCSVLRNSFGGGKNGNFDADIELQSWFHKE